ncbi:hypothetical protein UFOVP420_26 [uncultured Caudovirales phage]|uniref:Uncharacterized protein n=1 Tax=uncultured Caudovirales phage TaxID=2100421 RepID=A0A6J5M7R3_9CAUD|nr:hypothetical protein UFOVP420_26 [uncultured Caudovirales phage]
MSKIAIEGNASGTGTFTIASPNSNSSRTLSLPDGTGTFVVNGINSSIVSGTSVASTSGSSISFTSIPSWVKRITVMFNGVSVNGSAIVYIRLGTSSGSTNSGYLGASFYLNGGSSTQASTYWPVDGTSLGAASTRHGNCVITNVTGNTWSMNGSVSNSNDTGVSITSGSIPLAATLDRVLIEVSAGAFDAGTINILYE